MALSSAFGNEFVLSRADIHPTMEEIFKYHVDAKEVTPKHIQRSIKIFIRQFDPDKSYVLQSEIEPFINLSNKDVFRITQQYKAGNFDLFVALNQVFDHGIKRAQRLRQEAIQEMILDSKSAGSTSSTQLYFPANEAALKERIKAKLAKDLATKEKKTEATQRLELREKTLHFLDRQHQKKEQEFSLEGDRGEHLLVVQILKALARGLDAHTAFYTPQEAAQIRMSLEKEFEGVGVVLKEDVEGVTVVNVIKGAPADRCGKIHSGDLLVKIDKYLVSKLAYKEVLEKMDGGGRKELSLSVQHQDGTFDRVVLQREKIELIEERARYAYMPFADGIIGKIVLPAFYGSDSGADSHQDILDALRALKNHGKLRGLILDMRENSGGFLTQAVKVAGLFVRSGVIVMSKYSKGEVQYLRDVEGRVHYDGPLVILASKASASAAEIVAQALQDYGVAVVVGDERTYGKGSIQYQTIMKKESKRFFKVTVGRYYTVSGRSTQIEGVKADIVVPTVYSNYQMGERYLDFPLSSDRISPAFVDPLSDLQDGTKRWFKKNYLPNIQQRLSLWKEMVPLLRKNSEKRLASNPDFQNFIAFLQTSNTKWNWGAEDLQMEEAVQIIRDMTVIQSK